MRLSGFRRIKALTTLKRSSFPASLCSSNFVSIMLIYSRDVLLRHKLIAAQKYGDEQAKTEVVVVTVSTFDTFIFGDLECLDILKFS